MNKRYRFPLFLILAWVFAFIYEEIPRTFMRNIPGSQHLWEFGSGWFTFFLVWYGTIFIVLYFIFINRPIKYAVISGVIFGLLAETFYFGKMANVFSLVLFILLYFGMFYFPFKIMKILYTKEKTEKAELWTVIISQVIVFGMLVLIGLVS